MISQEELKNNLHYNSVTGIFTWITKTKNNVKKNGDVAGCINTLGYIQIQIKGEIYLAHRLAYLYMEGYFPEHVVDHINGIKKDNRWINLRHVSVRCNLQNGKLSKNNKSGFNGVHFSTSHGKWVSVIKVNRKSIYIGEFNTPEDAAIARVNYEENCPNWTCNAQDNNRKKLKELGLLP